MRRPASWARRPPPWASTASGCLITRIPAKPSKGKRCQHFDAAKELALQTGRLLKGSLLLGFDIAIDKTGPLIVEANPTPHLVMMEVSHQKGIMDEHMVAAMAYLDKIVEDRQQWLKDQLKAERTKSNAGPDAGPEFRPAPRAPADDIRQTALET